MVIENGKIQLISYCNGIDENGLPFSQEEAGETIPCNYATITQQRVNSQEEANFSTAAYSCLVDVSDIDIDYFILYNKRGKRIALCKAAAVEYLDEVDVTKITAVRNAD